MTLYGYRYSVYLRIARLALAEKGLNASHVEVDPFGSLPEGYLDLHPFGRVPVLDHGGFRLYETAAITRYIDEAFPGPALQPADPKARARMAQAIGIVDSYAYRPLVRQVFSHAVFRPALGEPADPAQIAEGMAVALRVLAALDRIAAEGLTLGPSPDLASLHLAPMLAYFLQAPGAPALLGENPALARWWGHFGSRPSLAATDPGRPVL
jgi:glutathione S-transferase